MFRRMSTLVGGVVIVAAVAPAAVCRGQFTTSAATNTAMATPYPYVSEGPQYGSMHLLLWQLPWLWAVGADPRVYNLALKELRTEVNFRYAQVFYEKQRAHAAREPEKKCERMKTAQDAAALKEHYQAVREMAELKRAQSKYCAAAPKVQPVNCPVLGGKCAWPVVLVNNVRFAADRQVVDALLANQAHATAAEHSAVAGQLKSAVARMQQNLVPLARSSELNGNDYIAAKKFLAALSSQIDRNNQEASGQLASN